MLHNHVDFKSPAGSAEERACGNHGPAGHKGPGGKDRQVLHGAHPHTADGSKVIWKWVATLALVALLHGSSARGAVTSPSQIWLPVVMVAPPAANPVYRGEATYYYTTGGGACSFGPSPDDLMVAAMNSVQYDNAAMCGAYVQVTGPKGAVTVRIVDLCPGCGAGDLDLSQEAFGQIAELGQGRVPITWQVVSPALSGPIAYHFMASSNEWWTAVQIRNHRNSVARLEYQRAEGEWVTVPRTSWNYFVQTSPGMGPGPYTLRVTDIYGNVLTDHGIPHVAGGTVNGSGQFPPGP
jgi:expansin (peptidoglycan-binding protein)